MNGVKHVDNLNELSIIGVNKLKKEIFELKDVPNKKFDELGLHRNEETLEIEGIMEPVSE